MQCFLFYEPIFKTMNFKHISKPIKAYISIAIPIYILTHTVILKLLIHFCFANSNHAFTMFIIAVVWVYNFTCAHLHIESKKYTQIYSIPLLTDILFG